MRTAFLYGMGKNAPCISLILLLIASMALVVVSKPASAAELPIVSLNPSVLEVPAPGANFTIDVEITDVTNMQGYEFKLGFNTTILNATAVTSGPINPVGTILGPVDPVTYQWAPLQNVSDGFVWVMAAFPLGQWFDGSGIAMTINFTALAMGNSTLDLFDTVMGDYLGQPIDHVAIDGSVTVGVVPPLSLISLNPLESAVFVGDSFTIDVNITDVTDLRAWEFKLDYDTTLLDATEVMYEGRITENNTDWVPTDLDTHEWIPINDTLGRVYAGALFPSGEEFTGSGTLVTINFTATAVGNCTLHLYDTMLRDSMGDPIAHDVGPDCSVTVIAKPPLPLLSLNPLEYTVLQGASFIIDVNITDVTNLQEYEFKLWFNNTLLNATDVIPGSVNPPGTPFIPDPLQNVSDGFVWAGASLPVGQAFTGSGIVMTINFTALAAGECTLHLNETVLTDPMEVEINHVTLDGYITVLPKIGDCHSDHLNDPTDDFPNDYAPMVIPVNGKNVMIAPVIRCTCLVGDVFEPHYYPCKLAQTLFVDDDWSDKDANYTYVFEDWTDYDWNDIVVSLYAITNDIIETEIHLDSRHAVWKNPFSVEITPEGLTVEVYWNSTDYPEGHIIRVNPDDTVDIELFAESNPNDTAFIIIIPLIPPVASFVYSPLHPQVYENVTFNASASTPNGGQIVSYEWDFGDSSPHEFGMIMTHHYTTAGTYNVTLNVTDSQGTWDTETKMITVTPRTFTLTITSTSGGTTDPVPGNYSYEEGTIVSVTAIPESDYVLDHWELDGVNVGFDTSTSVTINKDHTLHAVFEEAPSPAPPVGGHAIPIDNSHFLAPKIDLIPGIGLASVLLAAMAVTIILIRRRNKTLRREH